MTNFVDQPESRVQAGAARRDITPPVGIYHRMWGAARHDRSTGVHRPLFATALYLAPIQGETNQARAIVGLDHCLFWKREMDEFLSAVARRSGLSRDRISICFSHTHAAGLMGLERQELPGGDLIPAYLESTAEQVADAIMEAARSAEPSIITYANGHCDLAQNRDYLDTSKSAIVCGYNPGGLTDNTVLVGRTTRLSDGKTIAVLVNYACHPTTLAWENTLISPDFIGAMDELILSATGAPALFLQGASGDLGPRHGFVGDVSIADRNGRQLGYAVLSALESMPSQPGQRFAYSGAVVSGATLGRWDHQPLPPERLQAISVWDERNCHIELPYRTDLASREQTLEEKQRWVSEEQNAQANGDEAKTAQARAMIERANRHLTRIAVLPQGTSYPFQATIWRLGDAVWVPVEGEHYQFLQHELRTRFRDACPALIVTTLVNGSNVWYLPSQDAYGKKIYQEEVSVIARGGLEMLTEAIGSEIKELLEYEDH